MNLSKRALYLVLIVTFALWGAGMIALKFALVSFSITQVLFARVGMAAVLYMLLAPKWWPLPYQKGDWKYLGALVLFEPCLLFLCETTAIANTSASQGGVIAACFPLCTALVAWFLLGEKLTRKTVVGMVLAVFGVAGASLAAESSAAAPNPLFGNLCMFGAVLSSTGYAVCARYVTRRYSFLAVSAVQAIGGTLAFTPVVLLSDMPAVVETSSLFALLYLGIGVGFVAYLAFNFALERLEAGVVALFGNLIPISTLVLAYFILNERLTAVQALCVGLTLVGLVIAAWPEKTAPVPASN